MSTTSVSQPANGVRVKGHSPWVWALRRTITAVAILTVTIAGAAWLFYAAIDPDSEADAQPAARAAIGAPGETAALPAAGASTTVVPLRQAAQ